MNASLEKQVSHHRGQRQPAPWDANPTCFLKEVANELPFDSIAVGVVDSKRPQPDEILVASGWSDGLLTHWCEIESTRDSLFRSAKRRGTAIRTSQANCLPQTLTTHRHTMVQMLPESLPTQRWWWLMLARQQRPFSQSEQRITSLWVRQWQARFNRTREPGSGRMLIGHDGRLILCDPWTHTRLLLQPSMLPQLLDSFLPVVAQRWNRTCNNMMHDFAIELTGKPYWICFHNRPAIRYPQANHWYLELRALDYDDLPTVGPLPDDRIAQSIAYIHDHFHQSPTLSQVAGSASVSPFHFHRLFVRHVGISPKHYVQRKQLQVAKWLLRCSRQPIGSIAERSGFASHGHFTSTFHRVVGMSPTRYRETH